MGKRTLIRLFRIHAVLDVLVAIVFGTSRYLAIEKSHFFPPERHWEVQEVLLHALGATAVLVAIGFAACYIIAGRDPKLGSRDRIPSLRHPH